MQIRAGPIAGGREGWPGVDAISVLQGWPGPRTVEDKGSEQHLHPFLFLFYDTQLDFITSFLSVLPVEGPVCAKWGYENN